MEENVPEQDCLIGALKNADSDQREGMCIEWNSFYCRMSNTE